LAWGFQQAPLTMPPLQPNVGSWLRRPALRLPWLPAGHLPGQLTTPSAARWPVRFGGPRQADRQTPWRTNIC